MLRQVVHGCIIDDASVYPVLFRFGWSSGRFLGGTEYAVAVEILTS